MREMQEARTVFLCYQCLRDAIVDGISWDRVRDELDLRACDTLLILFPSRYGRGMGAGPTVQLPLLLCDSCKGVGREPA